MRHLDELRISSYPAGCGNNRLGLVFETAKILAWFSSCYRGTATTSSWTLKGVGCVDQYMEASKQDNKLSYTPPTH